MTADGGTRDLLKSNLTGAHKVAQRLLVSLRHVGSLMPLDAAKVDRLSDVQEEQLDALIFRFNSLTAMVQDHITRGILLCQEEDARASKRDQRHLMEKLGALKAELKFGTLAELRNRIAHHYPDDSGKQAEIVNEVYARSDDLLEGYDMALAYADAKIFGGALNLAAVSSNA